MTVGILTSGDIGYDTLVQLIHTEQVEFVLTDRRSYKIIKLCSVSNIPIYIGNPRNGKAYSFIKPLLVDVIISVNYLFLIEEDIIKHPNSLIFNIHGSLLPKYRGRTPHVWAIINGENKAGISAHRIDIGCDTGDIIEQIEVPIYSEDTGATILNKYKKLYFPLIQSVLHKLKDRSLVFTPQNNDNATYFGKRTPQDGLIDWTWPSKKIENWVRAQAFPYPGAFTFYRGEKITIDKISLEEERIFKEPGTILSVFPKIKIVTSDGIVSLVEIRENNIDFVINKKLE